MVERKQESEWLESEFHAQKKYARENLSSHNMVVPKYWILADEMAWSSHMGGGESSKWVWRHIDLDVEPYYWTVTLPNAKAKLQ